MNRFLEVLGSLGIALFYPLAGLGFVVPAYLSLLIGCIAWNIFGTRRRIVGLAVLNFWAACWVLVILVRIVR